MVIKMTKNYTEKKLKSVSGWPMLILVILMYIVGLALFIGGPYLATSGVGAVLSVALGVILFALAILFSTGGFKVVKPNEAYVMTLFGKYTGTLRDDGFYFVNPFSTSVNPTYVPQLQINLNTAQLGGQQSSGKTGNTSKGKVLSLKQMTLKNDKQKVNDLLGNPIEISVNVIWKISDTAKAVFGVDNYEEFLSIQSDSALRNIVRLYPYDLSADGDERSLRGSSQAIAEELKSELQGKVDVAGLEIVEVRITHLAYAQEIAAAMLQRQQATAIIEARQIIVEGAVGMVELALTKLSEGNVCELDEERKAQMVSNLLVVLCGSKETQPVINSGTLY